MRRVDDHLFSFGIQILIPTFYYCWFVHYYTIYLILLLMNQGLSDIYHQKMTPLVDSFRLVRIWHSSLTSISWKRNRTDRWCYPLCRTSDAKSICARKQANVTGQVFIPWRNVWGVLLIARHIRGFPWRAHYELWLPLSVMGQKM